MPIEKIRMRLQGVRPLLMHSSRLADPLDAAAIDLARAAAKRAKTRADHEAIARIEWHGGLWARDGLPCIPGEAIEAAFVAAARSVRKTRQAQIGFFCCESPLLAYPGPRSIEQLWADPAFRLRYPVRVHNARTIRTRPRFPEWSVVVEAEYVPTALSREEIIELFQLAGFREGLGDWRPRFGRFEAFEA
jgi:hypothetical protein